MLQMSTTALSRVGVGLRRPPSRSLLSRGLSPQMLGQIPIHVGVIPPLYGHFDQQIHKVIVRMRARFPLGCLSAVLPCLGRNLPHELQMRLCRPKGRVLHTPHELFQLRHELWNTGSCGKFGAWRQFLNLSSDTQVCFLDWIHLLQSSQEVAPVGALPDSGLDRPLKKYLFAQRFDERAFGPDISMLLTREEQKLEEFDLKIAVARAFVSQSGTSGSPVPPEGGEGCVVANGANPARPELFISASVVLPTVRTGTVFTRGGKGLGQVCMGELRISQPLFRSLVKSCTPGDMVGGGFFKS